MIINYDFAGYLRFLGHGNARRTFARVRVAGDPAQGARRVAGRDRRQTTVFDTTDRTGVPASVLHRSAGAVSRRTVRVIASRGLPSTPVVHLSRGVRSCSSG